MYNFMFLGDFFLYVKKSKRISFLKSKSSKLKAVKFKKIIRNNCVVPIKKINLKFFIEIQNNVTSNNVINF